MSKVFVPLSAEAGRYVASLEDALRKLANEATGFLSMADREAHGVTNMRVLQLRIDEARAALEGTVTYTVTQPPPVRP